MTSISTDKLTHVETLCFKSIYEFIADLDLIFGGNNRELHLYASLLSKVSIGDVEGTRKHIAVFNSFYNQQVTKDAVLNRRADDLKEARIEYSEKAYVDCEFIFNTTSDNQECIWEHLLTIGAIIDPSSQAKHILKSLQQARKPETGDVLGNIISKIQAQAEGHAESMNENANPVEVVTAILQSGAFTEIVQDLSRNLENGNVDLNSLLSAMNNPLSINK